MYANVAIDVKNPHINDEYVYLVPDTFLDYIAVGSRVLVDFGMRRVLGYVLSLSVKTDFTGDIRNIVDVLDFTSELTEEQVALAKLMKEDIGCSLISALDSMIPSFMRSKYRKFARLVRPNEVDPEIFLLFNSKKKIALSKELITNYPKIKKEIDKGNIEIEFDTYSYGKTKYEKVYSINPNSENVFPSLDKMRKRVVDFLKANGEKTINELKEYVGCSGYLIQSMTKAELITETKKPIVKKQNSTDSITNPNIKFDFEKKNIIDRFINGSVQTPYLFSSNDKQFEKEFILSSIIDTLKKDKNVLICSPTLLEHYSLQYYLCRNIPSYEIASFSGDMSQSDYYDNYRQVKDGNARVVLTTKVGAFTPLSNIGLIIVLDESNYNYINEMTPKYNVVTMLKKRAALSKAKLALISNPLTVENYYNYTKAKYNLLKYTKAINNNYYLVNMMEEAMLNKSLISRKLEIEIEKSINRGKQVMLLLNSKGYSNHLVCPKCGRVAKCEKCNIPLTHSKEKNEISCRYCGRKLENLKCKCGNSDYAMFSFGIEKVKEELNLLFPSSNVLLVDANSMRDYEDFKNAVVRIESGDVNIIVGTSNILSLCRDANVDLFGIISIDSMLNLNDYKASYQTFYHLYNGLSYGALVVQGYYLDHYAISCALNNDFNTFYEKEIEYRQAYNYPPFSEINRVLITGEYKDIYHCAYYIRKVYNSVTGTDENVLGPTYVRIKKGVQLIFKNNDFDKLKKIVDETTKKFDSKKVLISLERYVR